LKIKFAIVPIPPVNIKEIQRKTRYKASVPVVILDATKFQDGSITTTVAPPALRLDVVILVADTLDNELTQLLINLQM
jgi:hypothetical protein